MINTRLRFSHLKKPIKSQTLRHKQVGMGPWGVGWRSYFLLLCSVCIFWVIVLCMILKVWSDRSIMVPIQSSIDHFFNPMNWIGIYHRSITVSIRFDKLNRNMPPTPAPALSTQQTTIYPSPPMRFQSPNTCNLYPNTLSPTPTLSPIKLPFLFFKI